MNGILLKSNDKSSLKLFQELARKMKIEFEELTTVEMEDLDLARKIEKGMKSKTVSRKAVMNALGHEG